MHITNMKIENHQKIIHLSYSHSNYIYIYILFFRKYDYMSKIFAKVNLKFYSNFTTHNQTYDYFLFF